MSVLRRIASGTISTLVVLLSITFSLLPRADAATRYWRNSAATSSWNTNSNWSTTSASGPGTADGGVPALNDVVRIENSDGVSHTVNLDVTTPTLGLVTIDQSAAGSAVDTLSITNNFTMTAAALFVGGYSNGTETTGRGAVTQSTGTVSMTPQRDLAVGYGLGSTGTYTLSGTGMFNATQSEFIGYKGNGTFNQSGGTNTVIDNSVGSFFIAGVAGSTGTYNLSGNTSSKLNVNVNEDIGYAGTGLLLQTGGVNTIGINSSTSLPYDLNLGYTSGSAGTYTISAGSVSAPGFVYVGGSAGGSGGAGTINISSTGSMTVGTELVVFNGASNAVNLSGGTLNATSINFTPSQFHWTGGTLNLTTDVMLANKTKTGGANHITSSLGSTSLTLSSGQTLSTTGSETLGNSFSSYALTMNAGSANTVATGLVVSRTGVINLNGGALSANIEGVGDDPVSGASIQQNGGTNTIATSLQVGFSAAGANGTYILGGTGLLSAAAEQFGVSGNGFYSQNNGTNTVTNDLTVGFSGAGTGSFDMSGGTTNVGGNVLIGQSSGASEMTIGGSGTLNVTGTLQVANKSTASLNLTGGTINTAALNFNGGASNFHWTEGTLNLTTSVTWDPFASSTSTGAAFDRGLTLGNFQTLSVTGTETLGGVGGFLLDLGSGSRHNVSSTLTIAPNSELRLDGGTLTVAGLNNTGGTFNFLAGTLQVTGAGANINSPIDTGSNTTINVFANNSSLGSASSFAGFSHGGTLVVGGNTVTLNSAGFAKLGVLTTMSGGTIHAANGVTFGSGSNLQGSGNVVARITGDSGAVIEASGALSLGDATSPAGFAYNGELRTKQFAVTLNSTAPVGLGNLTTVGNGGTAGTLSAANGFVVDFDGAISGFGTINSSNTLAKHATINGTVQGASAAQPITFSGYIKGDGSFTNVTFAGTFSPGLSPTVTNAGNLALASSNTLVMEVGGTTAGTSYDQIQASGQLSLGGVLNVSLINGFTPTAGQVFDLFDWQSLAGTFSTLMLPALSGSLTWNTSNLYTNGTLSVVAGGVPGDYNQNGVVDAADYVLWRNNLGSGTSLPNDDTPGVGNDDYSRWRSHFGQTAGGGAGVSGSGTAVPEASTAALFLIGLVGFVGGERIRR